MASSKEKINWKEVRGPTGTLRNRQIPKRTRRIRPKFSENRRFLVTVG